MKHIVTVAASTPEYTRKGEGDVIELADGRLLMIYMEFTGDGSDFAWTRLVAQESADGGLTWGAHRVITETAPGCRFTSRGQAIVNYWTCEYLPDWRMQDVIDLRVAVIDAEWFYEQE